MNISGGLEMSALNAMVRKLRRHHVPFSAEELDKDQWEEVQYSFEHIVEVCLALKLLAEGISFRHVVSLLTGHRPRLRKLFATALIDADSGRGSALEVSVKGRGSTNISGLYLDFHATHEAGVLAAGRPELLDPWDALQKYMGFYRGLHPVGLIRLSQLATEAVRLAQVAPAIRRGRREAV
jgi:hypothetical protein